MKSVLKDIQNNGNNLALLLCCLIVCVNVGAYAQSQVNNETPNIILIMADDLGYGDTGFNGNTIIQTPNLDQMAKEGVKFSHFYSASSVCSPTRGSFLTGRHPHRYGIFWANVGHLPKEEITLAEILKEQGYATGHFGKWHLGTLSKQFHQKERNVSLTLITLHQHGMAMMFHLLLNQR